MIRQDDRWQVSLRTLVAVFLLTIGGHGAALAAGSPVAKCVNTEQKAAGKAVDGKLKCHGAQFKNGAVDAACLDAKDDKLVDSFLGAEAKGGCAVTGNSSVTAVSIDTAVEGLVDALPGQTSCDVTSCDACYGCVAGSGGWCEAAVVACFNDTNCVTLNNCYGTCGTDEACLRACEATYPNGLPIYNAAYDCWLSSCPSTCTGEKRQVTDGDKCALSKRKAASKLLAGKVKCWAAAHNEDTVIDPGCSAKAEAKFTDSFSKAEATGACGTNKGAAEVRQIVDQLVWDLQTRVPMVAGSYISCTGLSCEDCLACSYGPGGPCEAQVDACYADTDCAAATACINACSTPQCVQNCQFAHPGTFSQAVSAYSCVLNSCTSVCVVP